MNAQSNPEPALQPNDLGRFFVERANAGDLEGLVALYEADAVVAGTNGEVITGKEAIREFFAQILSYHPQFGAGDARPALVQGDIALTSTRLASGVVTAEIARRQPDGTWLWVVDNPAIATPDAS